MKVSITRFFLTFFLFVSGLTTTNLSYAVGLGGAETRSAIGQPMRVQIPLFNVVNPDGLQFTIQNLDENTSTIGGLTAALDRSNSQLSVVILSEQIVNEPFLSFALTVSDGSTTISRDFTVLFNLPGGASLSADQVVQQNLGTNTQLNVSNLAASGTVSGTMGPYDWAQAGQIPEKFGPVLDGQSLWRVARRINKAMGVSIEQMMLGLYKANPQAFSTGSIESLQAGEVLTIPSADLVKSVGQTQAVRELASVSDNLPAVANSGSIEPTQPQPNQELASSLLDEFSDEDGAQESAPAFQLTGIADGVLTGAESDVAAQGGDGQSQAIIQSLAETVGNLSQELIRKDQQIEVLEGQVEELTRFIREEGNQPPLLSTPEDAELDAAVAPEQSIVDSIADDTQLSETSDPEPAIAVESEVPNVSAETREQAKPSLLDSLLKWWPWALLALLLAAVFLLRHRLANLFRSLNLGDSDDSLTFEQQQAEPQVRVSNEDKTVYRDYSVMQSITKDEDASDELVEGVSYLKLGDDEFVEIKDTSAYKKSSKAKTDDEASEDEDEASKSSSARNGAAANDDNDSVDFDDGSYEANEVLDLEEALAEDDEEDLTFDERFSNLLAEKDFNFARELLDFARYNEINDDRYHCERLRLLKSMDDEDGFYEYYYEIESKIPSFPPKLQTEISQFVVQLAQGS